MSPVWNQEFLNRHLPLHHEDPKIFVRSQWQRTSYTPVWYICVRSSVALFFVVTWTISMIDPSHLDAPPSYRNKQWIYLSHWGYTTCTIQSLLSVIMVISTVLGEKKNGPAYTSTVNKFLYMPYWVTNVIATDVGFMITIIFWAIQFPNKEDPLAPLMFIIHACNSMLMLFDACVVAHPVRLLHFYIPAIFLTIYVSFSLIYFLAGGTSKTGSTAIYSLLDWNVPERTVLACLGILVLVFGLHLLMYSIYKLKVFLSERIMGYRENTSLFRS